MKSFFGCFVTIWLQNKIASQQSQDRGSSLYLKSTLTGQPALIPFIYQYQSQLCQQPNPAPRTTAILSTAKIKVHFQVIEKTDGCSQASTGPQALP